MTKFWIVIHYDHAKKFSSFAEAQARAMDLSEKNRETVIVAEMVGFAAIEKPPTQWHDLGPVAAEPPSSEAEGPTS